MKTIPAVVQTGIDNGTIATCVHLQTKDGTDYGFTDHDRSITFSGVTYVATPGLTQIKMNQRDNAEVSNQEMAGAWVVDLDDNDLSSGKFDDAEFEVFIINWDESVSGVVTDRVIKLKGNTGILQWSEDGFRVDVHSAMKQLSNSFGFTTTASCRHKLYGAADPTLIGNCGVTPVPVNNSVNTVTSSKMKFVAVTTDTAATGQYDGGTLTWTGGTNSGLTTSVKSSVNNANIQTFTFYLPTDFVIVPGDTFSVTPGCDKSFEICKTKFNNAVNFGGFPHIRNEVNFK